MSEHGFDRRQLLRGLGVGAAGLAAGRLLAACSGGSSGISGGGSSGSKPALNVWYHQYGEAGTQQAVERYAKEYPNAAVNVQWTPGDYTSKLNAGLLSTSGPDVFESSVNIDQVKSGQVVPLDDIIADVKSDYTEADIKSSTVERQDLSSQDGRRHGGALLPQERAGQGGCEAADHASTS